MVNANRKVGTQETTVEDIHAPVEPGNPFWLPLWDDLAERTLRKIGPKATKGQLSKQEPPAQVAYLAGDVDGMPWECVVQTDRVKTAPRRYERGWARIIALTCGIDIRTAAEKGRKPQDDVDLNRITYAATAALDRLEQARRYIDRLHYQPQMPGEPDIPVADLPRDEQVLEVARAYNAAVEQGIWGVRGHVMAATGLTEATTRRRISAAREQGLIPKETK